MEKKILKKVAFTVMALLLAMSVFAACGQQPAEPAQSSASQAAQPSVSETASAAPSPSQASSAPAASGKKIKVGLSFGTLEQERWMREKENMDKYAAELGNIELIFQSANNDETKQLTQAENLISQKVDYLVVVPQDAEASAQIVAQAHKSNIPVIAYDRMILNCDLDYYVSFDSVKVGELMTDYVLAKQPKGNYVVLKGGPTDNNAHLVYKGIMNKLQPAIDKGDVKVVLDQWCKDWSQEEALKNTENALTSANNDVQVVISSYDGMSNGAIQALKAQSLSGKVLVTGQDAELSACQRIVEGTQSMTVYKPINDLSKALIDTIVTLASGKELKIDGKVNNGKIDVPSILPEIYSVDKDNIVDVIIKSGFQKVEDVYANIPKDQWPK